MNLAIVVPIKSSRRAKQRLEAVLTEEERTRLADVMAEEVLRETATLGEYGRFVVSEDAAMLELARHFGFEAIEDRAVQGQSAAVRQGFAAAWARGFSAVLTIPGDVPAVRPQDLREVAEFRPEVEVLLVPDRDGVGTNGLRVVPPYAIALRFGEDSLSLHRAEAQRANRSFALHPVERLAYDLDRPEDLIAFLRLAPETATLGLLHELGVPERISALTRPPA